MIDAFQIGKIYKVNTVLATDKQVIGPGVVITVLNIEHKNTPRFLSHYYILDNETRITLLFDNKKLYARDWGDRLLYYFNEVKE